MVGVVEVRAASKREDDLPLPREMQPERLSLKAVGTSMTSMLASMREHSTVLQHEKNKGFTEDLHEQCQRFHSR